MHGQTHIKLDNQFSTYLTIARSEVITAVNMKITVFRNVTPCTMVEEHQRSCETHHHYLLGGFKMEIAEIS